MPISRNRKGHRQKAMARKVREKQRKAHLENMYKAMMQELRTKNTSVPEMLNKEDEIVEATNGYLNSLTPEEQAEQDLIQASAVLTTNANVIDTEAEVIYR
jgi:hypothetical protein